MPTKRRLTWIALVVALAGLAWHASLPAPLGPAAGTRLEGDYTKVSPLPLGEGDVKRAPSALHSPLRIATFNIHGSKGTDGRRDVGRVASCLENLDFVALNEVHGSRLWQKLDQAGQLGEQLGMGRLFAPCVRTWYHLDSGNGLLSRLPVEFWQRMPLERQGDRGYRNAVLVGLKHGDRTIRVLLTHVVRREDRGRQEQLRAVIAMYLALAEPAILLGDLNSTADDPQIARLLATPGVGDPLGEKLGSAAPRRIDWIITRGLRTRDAGMRDNGASDHPLLWAELE